MTNGLTVREDTKLRLIKDMFRLIKLQWPIPGSYRVSQLQQYFSTKSQDDFIARHFRYSNGQPPLLLR
jgi:hypothetical protein